MPSTPNSSSHSTSRHGFLTPLQGIWKGAAAAITALLLIAGSAWAHDLFLKLHSYFLNPDSDATIALYNGTFEQSENIIARDRMLDVSVVGPADTVVHPDTAHWHDDGQTTILDFRTGEPGTYLIGVSTKPRMIELTGAEFNDYLEHDGILDHLEMRRTEGKLNEPASERYAKHVKAIFQVGDNRSGAYSHRLGYPIEIIPLKNPYDLAVGDSLSILVLLEGVPLANELVYASYEGHHGHDADAGHAEAVHTRTDSEGVAVVPLSAPGRWYTRLIHMEELSEPGVTHESKWATLTFAVR